jgi:hypothetical protein
MYGDCNGKGPAAWITTTPWPSPYCKGPDDCGTDWPVSKFNASFEPDLANDPTLLDVLTGENEVAKYVVAALLNYAEGSVPAIVLPESTIKHIWNEFATSLRFTPMPGASWSQLEIVDYLRSTMTSG